MCERVSLATKFITSKSTRPIDSIAKKKKQCIYLSIAFNMKNIFFATHLLIFKRKNYINSRTCLPSHPRSRIVVYQMKSNNIIGWLLLNKYNYKL